MNKSILLLSLIFMIGLASAWSTNNLTNYGSERMESYLTGQDQTYFFYGAEWRGETFTVGTTGTNRDFIIDSVDLVLTPEGASTGLILTASIRATDGTGKPIGPDLSSGSISTDLIVLADVYRINMTPITLSASTKYALIWRLNGGDGTNHIKYFDDSTSPTYSGGAMLASSNSGVTWDAPYTSDDALFAVNGRTTSPTLGFLGENITISNNITRFIKIPSSISALTNAFINLSGINYNTTYNFTYGDAINTIVFSLSNRQYGQNFTATSNKINKICWILSNGTQTIRLNMSLKSTVTGADLVIKNTTIQGTHEEVCINTDYNAIIGNTYWIVVSNFTKLDGTTAGQTASIWHTSASVPGYGSFDHDSGTYTYSNQIKAVRVEYNSSYPVNPNILIGTDTVWDYINEFNITGYNRTNNLANTINTYLNPTYQIGSYYYVPVVFDSNTNSIIEYSDLLFSSDGFTENSQTYNSISYSGSTETFSINITYDTNNYPSAVGYLVYNNTIYSSSSTAFGTNQIFTTSITVPSIQAVYPFYWILNLTNSTGITSYNSSNYTQTIDPILFQFCNQSFNVSYVNFTIYDLDTNKKTNATFKASFNYGSNSLGLSYAFQDLTGTNSSFKFCFSPSDTSYNISANIEYESPDYAKNYYYLTGASFSNQTTSIPLYLLNSSKATATILQTKDLSKIPVADVIIQIQAYDAGTDTYKTVSMAKSDYNGEDISYLNWYDTFYKFILTKNGNLLLITNSSKISSSPKQFLVGGNFQFEYDKFNNVIYSLTFNNITNNFILTYTDPSGQISSNCLRVIKRNILNDTIICNTCESSSSATLYCNIASYGNGTYIATYYGVGSLHSFDTIEAIIGFTNSMHDLIGNKDGIIYAILLSLVVLGVSLVSPVFAIVGAILGVIGSMALGFLPIREFLLPTIGLCVVGGIIIWLLKR